MGSGESPVQCPRPRQSQLLAGSVHCRKESRRSEGVRDASKNSPKKQRLQNRSCALEETFSSMTRHSPFGTRGAENLCEMNESLMCCLGEIERQGVSVSDEGCSRDTHHAERGLGASTLISGCRIVSVEAPVCK